MDLPDCRSSVAAAGGTKRTQAKGEAMKIKFTGFTDNTYKELKTIELEDVEGLSINADDCFLNVSRYENATGQMKQESYTSLQWAKGVEVFP